jgi:ArsR family transcriptional regulator
MENEIFELKAGILKMLAQPTRLKILECLKNGERCICDIIPAIGGEQSNISKHISLMQKNHLVTTQKDGVKVIVKISDPKLFEILDNISLLLKKQIVETGKLINKLS